MAIPRSAREWIQAPGIAGARYSASEVAGSLGVDLRTVVSWIERGWLRAARSSTGGYRIRQRAVRRLLCDYPEAAERVAEASIRRTLAKHGL